MTPNLRAREAWRAAISSKTGEPVKDVIESVCQTFRICQTTANRKTVYLVWRQRRRPQGPDLVGGYETPDAARDACARYLERPAK